MTVRGNTTDGPQQAITVPAQEDDHLGDRWVGAALGKFKIIRRLGRGGMGVVYEAFDPILQRTVAIKMLRESITAQADAFRKFLREAQTAARLNSPHVVQVYEANEEKGHAYLVMELMEGGSAHDRIGKWGAFDWVEATQVMADACQGLAAVHAAGLIHRDIKPSNIMRAHAHDGAVKLADFGLALTFTNPGDSSAQQGQVVGTPLFMSPEQCRAQKLGPHSDIYSLGATYYTLLTGMPPFEGKSAWDVMNGHCCRPIPDPCALNSSIPAACAELIRKTMAKEPADRPADAAVLLKEFQAILALATSPEIQTLDWASSHGGGDKLAVTPIPGVLTTAIEAVAPIYVTTRKPRTRAWFVGFCLVLTVFAFIMGRHFSQPTLPPPPAGQRLVETVNKPPEEDKPIAKEKKSGPKPYVAGGPVTSLAFDPVDDNDVLSWSTNNGKLRIFELLDEHDRYSKSLSETAGQNILEVGFASFKNERYWAALFNGAVHFFTLDGSNVKPFEQSTAVLGAQGKKVISFQLHPEQKLIALAVRDEAGHGGFFIQGVRNRSLKVEARTEDGQAPVCLAFSTNGSLLLTCRDNGMIDVWRVVVRKQKLSNVDECVVERRATIRMVGRPVAAAGVDNEHFAVAIDGQVWLCDGLNRSTVGTAENKIRIQDCPDPITALISLPTEKKLAWGCGKFVFLYDLETKQARKFAEHSTLVTALAFDARRRRLASGDEGGKIIIQPLE